MRRHHISFKHAFDGILYVIRSQPNFRIHMLAAFVVSVSSWWLKVSLIEWLVLLFAIMLVICAEMINTSIESMVDLITKEHHTEAKVAKDVAAGMVLVTAMMAVLVGLFVLGPYIIRLVP